MSAISILTAHYDDAALYEMIRIARTGELIPEAKVIATRLQKGLLEHWLAAAQKPDDVFHFMKLGQAGYSFRSDSEFAVWVKYVDDLNAKHTKNPTLMGSTLSENYDVGACSGKLRRRRAS